MGLRIGFEVNNHKTSFLFKFSLKFARANHLADENTNDCSVV